MIVQLQKDAMKAAELSVAAAIVTTEGLVALGVMWFFVG